MKIEYLNYVGRREVIYRCMMSILYSGFSRLENIIIELKGGKHEE